MHLYELKLVVSKKRIKYIIIRNLLIKKKKLSNFQKNSKKDQNPN